MSPESLLINFGKLLRIVFHISSCIRGNALIREIFTWLQATQIYSENIECYWIPCALVFVQCVCLFLFIVHFQHLHMILYGSALKLSCFQYAFCFGPNRFSVAPLPMFSCCSSSDRISFLLYFTTALVSVRSSFDLKTSFAAHQNIFSFLTLFFLPLYLSALFLPH